ncbi:DUF3874 domain-containing protein [Bacteroides stercorirosoris]|uniref:DUF3874 domain-containing protein n=1 Tax=Bacteroides stercorirosoris TaxID=871324 RepID=UPI0009E096FF
MEQLFLCHFRAAAEGEEGVWMTPMEIISFLQKKDQGPAVHQQSGLLRTCTHKFGISNRRKKRGNEYHVIINKSI